MSQLPIDKPEEVIERVRNGEGEEAELAGIDLSGRDLTELKLRKANLTGANLSQCKLKGVGFARAKLNGANLSNSVIDDATLTKASVKKANLSALDEFRSWAGDVVGPRRHRLHRRGGRRSASAEGQRRRRDLLERRSVTRHV